MKYIAIAAVAVTLTATALALRKYPKICFRVIPILLVAGMIIALMVGCSPQVATEKENDLNIPADELLDSLDATPASIPSASPSPTPSPEVTTVPAPEDNTYADIEANHTCPTPQIIEVPVETVIELPGQTVEVIREVYVDTPLDGMDMRKRQLEFIDELNAKYNSVFGMKIGGGEYCYNFTTKTECLVSYYFVSDTGVNIPCIIPLSLNADTTTIEIIKNEIKKGE